MRRSRAERLQGDPPGAAWCSGHKEGSGAWVAIEQFARDGSKWRQRYCRECHKAYMRHWRQRGLPAQEREAYVREQRRPATLAAIAAKYANRP